MKSLINSRASKRVRINMKNLGRSTPPKPVETPTPVQIDTKIKEEN